MKFKIESTFYGTDPDKLLKHYPFLKAYSFYIEEKKIPRKTRIRDENGNFMIQEYGYSIEKTPYIHVDHIPDIIKLEKSVEYPLIIDSQEIPTIEIYDSYRE